MSDVVQPAGRNRVQRGGSWNNNARNVRSANRNNNAPGNRNNNIGFRLASSGHRPNRCVHGFGGRARSDQPANRDGRSRPDEQ